MVLVKAGAAGPGAKGYAPVMKIAEFGIVVSLPDPGPFDLYLVPKEGRAVRVAEKWEPKGTATEVTPANLVGVLYVRGDDLPRAGKVVVTDPRDPGPDEKGHVPVQEAADYKTDLLVRPGVYAVWVKPANGARAQKVEDKVRVAAGRVTQVPE